MEPEIEGRLVSDHRILSHRLYRRIGMTFLGLCFLIGAVYAGYMYYAAPAIIEEQAKVDSNNFIAKKMANVAPFAFTIVPEALTTLTVPEQATPSLQDLTTEFTDARATLPSINDAEIESIYDLPVGDITFLEYLNNLPRDIQDPLLQMQSEIDVLVVALNKTHEQKTLAVQIGRDGDLLYEDATRFDGEVSVYPSHRVAEARLVSEVLARQFPSEADFFREYTNEYIAKGVAYGHYSKLDAAVSLMLVDDYLKVAEQNEQAKVVLQSLE